MLLRKYEIVVIINAKSGDEGNDKALGRMREALESTGGKEARLESWGVRRMAYEMDKTRKGHYFYMLFLGGNTTVAEMERLLNITEPVMKFQTLMIEDRVEADTFDFEAAKKELTEFGKKAMGGKEVAA